MSPENWLAQWQPSCLNIKIAWQLAPNMGLMGQNWSKGTYQKFKSSVHNTLQDDLNNENISKKLAAGLWLPRHSNVKNV